MLYVWKKFDKVRWEILDALFKSIFLDFQPLVVHYQVHFLIPESCLSIKASVFERVLIV